jgi:hypothetical protein
MRHSKPCHGRPRLQKLKMGKRTCLKSASSSKDLAVSASLLPTGATLELNFSPCRSRIYFSTSKSKGRKSLESSKNSTVPGGAVKSVVELTVSTTSEPPNDQVDGAEGCNGDDGKDVISIEPHT